MKVAFAVVATLLGAVGALMLSSATAGVGVIGLALLAGIAARIEQASGHQKQVMAQLAAMKAPIDSNTSTLFPEKVS